MNTIKFPEAMAVPSRVDVQTSSRLDVQTPRQLETLVGLFHRSNRDTLNNDDVIELLKDGYIEPEFSDYGLKLTEKGEGVVNGTD